MSALGFISRQVIYGTAGVFVAHPDETARDLAEHAPQLVECAKALTAGLGALVARMASTGEYDDANLAAGLAGVEFLLGTAGAMAGEASERNAATGAPVTPPAAHNAVQERRFREPYQRQATSEWSVALGRHSLLLSIPGSEDPKNLSSCASVVDRVRASLVRAAQLTERAGDDMPVGSTQDVLIAVALLEGLQFALRTEGARWLAALRADGAADEAAT